MSVSFPTAVLSVFRSVSSAYPAKLTSVSLMLPVELSVASPQRRLGFAYSVSLIRRGAKLCSVDSASFRSFESTCVAQLGMFGVEIAERLANVGLLNWCGEHLSSHLRLPEAAS